MVKNERISSRVIGWFWIITAVLSIIPVLFIWFNSRIDSWIDILFYLSTFIVQIITGLLILFYKDVRTIKISFLLQLVPLIIYCILASSHIINHLSTVEKQGLISFIFRNYKNIIFYIVTQFVFLIFNYATLTSQSRLKIVSYCLPVVAYIICYLCLPHNYFTGVGKIFYSYMYYGNPYMYDRFLLVLTFTANIGLIILSNRPLNNTLCKISALLLMLGTLLSTVYFNIYFFANKPNFRNGFSNTIMFVFSILLITGMLIFPFVYIFPSKEKSHSPNDNYISIGKHVLLCLFTFGIWYLIWVYRTTAYLNKAPKSEQYDPTSKLLLFMFVPFYSIYWYYKHGQKLDAFPKARHMSGGNMTTLCLILGIFLPIVSCILMQDKINYIIQNGVSNDEYAPLPEYENNQIQLLKRLKELYEADVITWEEFEERKRQILNNVMVDMNGMQNQSTVHGKFIIDNDLPEL